MESIGLSLPPMRAADPFGENCSKSPPPIAAPLVSVRHYASDHSIFINDDYLIKGVAGAILWKLLVLFTQESRTLFTNRELRLDPEIGLPPFSGNLEARLVLLRRRLEERSTVLRIEKEGRGRFRLAISSRLALREIRTKPLTGS
jgi:adenylate cyclase